LAKRVSREHEILVKPRAYKGLSTDATPALARGFKAMTIMAFGAIFAGAGLSAQPGLLTAAVATFGVACGSLAWWTLLVTGVALARHAVGDRLLAGINVASGALVAVFGVIAVVSVFVR